MTFRLNYSMLLLGILTSAAFGQSKDVVITGAKIEVGNGTVIANGSIYIHDGKIAAVGESVQSPDGATRIDGTGWTVYPGFIDAYSTKGLRLPDAAAAGTPPDSRTTAPASMWHANRKNIRGEIIAAKCLDIAGQLDDNYKMGVTTALLSSGNGSVRGISSVVDYVSGGNVVKQTAAAEFGLRGGGFGGGGGGGGGYPGTLFGTTALLRQVIADTQTYAATTNPKADPVYENLKPLVQGQIPGIFVADNAREIVRAGHIADEFGFKLIIAGGREAYREIPTLKVKNTPVLLSLDISSAPNRKAETGPDATPQAVVDDRYNIWEEHSKNAKLLNEAGIPLGFSIGGSYADYLTGVRKLIGFGLPRDAALKAMTSGSAQILGVSDQLGTIETGKLANLTIMNGDFADEKSAVICVFVEGKRVDVKKEASK